MKEYYEHTKDIWKQCYTAKVANNIAIGEIMSHVEYIAYTSTTPSPSSESD